MTKKRFQIIHLGNPYDFVVKDHNTNKTYGTLQGDDKSLMKLLNELHEEKEQLQSRCNDYNVALKTLQDLTERKLNEENEQLKFQLQNTSLERDEFHRGARENANLVGKLKKENKQLKETNQELYDFRLILNALLFNEWVKNGKYEVYKSKRHHDGSIPFPDDNED